MDTKPLLASTVWLCVCVRLQSDCPTRPSSCTSPRTRRWRSGVAWRLSVGSSVTLSPTSSGWSTTRSTGRTSRTTAPPTSPPSRWMNYHLGHNDRRNNMFDGKDGLHDIYLFGSWKVAELYFCNRETILYWNVIFTEFVKKNFAEKLRKKIKRKFSI